MITFLYMRPKKKLEIDSDHEEFTPAAEFSELEGSPQMLSFESSRPITKQYFPSSRVLAGEVSAKQNKKKYKGGLTSNFENLQEPSSKSHHENTEQSDSLMRRTKTNAGQEKLFKAFPSTKSGVESRRDRLSSGNFMFENNQVLKSIVKSQKINKIKQNFIKKISRTSTAHPPVDLETMLDEGESKFLDFEGFEIPPLLESTMNFLAVSQLLGLLIAYSLSLTFAELAASQNSLRLFQILSLLFYIVEILINSMTVRFVAGKKITHFRQIAEYYLHHNLLVDLLSVLIMIVDIGSDFESMRYFRLLIIFKLPQCLGKIQKLEVTFINNIYNEQYWELAKVFLVNFAYAHIIALFLAAMEGMSSEQNWMAIKGITNSPWAIKYVWSFYWAVNIMLTVGFGDLSANNYKEAISLIFIETFSCIVMAYNINRMGSIISNIRAEDQKRSRKYKIFKKLTQNNYVPEELNLQINNYIEESSNIKKMFNYEEDKEFVSELPDTLKSSFLRQSNKEVLKHLVFFKDLLDKTLFNFAEHFENIIAHPQQIIRALEDDFHLIIIKKGSVGYGCKRNGWELNDQIVDLIEVDRDSPPFLTSLQFISKTRPSHQIISLSFTVLYRLDYSDFINIFKESEMDYELYCFLRDKIRNIPDEFEVYPCEYCKGRFNHFKFTCPRLHYAPFQQHVIDKELHKEKVGHALRKKVERIKPEMYTPFKYYNRIKAYRQELEEKNRAHRERMNSNSMYTSAHQLRGSRFLAQIDGMVQPDLTLNHDHTTKQIIEGQFLRRDKREEYRDQVWQINLDMMHDYNNYFLQNNPSTLQERFSFESRMQQQEQRQVLFQKHFPPKVIEQADTKIMVNGYIDEIKVEQ